MRLSTTSFKRGRRSFSSFSSGANSPYGHRERLAEKYLEKKEWTVEKLLQSRKALKEHTGYEKQLQVNWISGNEVVSSVAQEMVQRSIGSMLVCDNMNDDRKRFLGIITERDFLRKVLGKNLQPAEVKVKDIMTPRKVLSVVTLDHTLYECLHVFEKGDFRHLPVVAARGDLGPEDEDVLAVLSQRDLVHEFRKFHEANLQYIESFVDFPIW